MTHDEAIAALESLPEVSRITVARLRPTDVVVLEYQGIIGVESCQRLTAHLQPIFPDNKIIVLEAGLTMKIVDGQA